ncbi:MAG: preprotein translocase subunit SecE [Tenericutes bacterium]|nr:preprotein translocase subunit SecE [Mycoplasmatota bacterium]
MKKLARFLVSVKKEMAKVRWPEKKELIKYSIATVCVVVVFSAFFGLLDVVLSTIKTVIH